MARSVTQRRGGRAVDRIRADSDAVKRVRRTTGGGGGRFVSQAFLGWREIDPLKLSLMATGYFVL